MSFCQQGLGGKSIPRRTPDDFDREAIKKEIFEGIIPCTDEKAAMYRRMHQSQFNLLSVMPARDLRKFSRYENLFRSETVLAALEEREKLLQSSRGNCKETTDRPSSKQKKKKKKRKSAQEPTKETQTPGESSSSSHINNHTKNASTSNLVTTDNQQAKISTQGFIIPLVIKLFKVIVRGIPAETSIDEISLELKKKGLEIKKVIQFSKREDNSYVPLPIFLVTLSALNHYKKICNLKSFKEYPITVEKFRKSRELVQCFRCQGFNHSPKECTLPPRCMKCAGEHFSYQCTNSRDTPAKCCNCQKNHTANFSGCTARPRRKRNGKPNLIRRDISSVVRQVMDEIKAYQRP